MNVRSIMSVIRTESVNNQTRRAEAHDRRVKHESCSSERTIDSQLRLIVGKNRNDPGRVMFKLNLRCTCGVIETTSSAQPYCSDCLAKPLMLPDSKSLGAHQKLMQADQETEYCCPGCKQVTVIA